MAKKITYNDSDTTYSDSGIYYDGAPLLTAIQDAGNTTDIVDILAKVEAFDSGSATESISNLANIAVSDSAKSSEALNVLVKLLVSDTGAATDIVDIKAIVSVLDTATFTELVKTISKTMDKTQYDLDSKQDINNLTTKEKVNILKSLKQDGNL